LKIEEYKSLINCSLGSHSPLATFALAVDDYVIMLQNLHHPTHPQPVIPSLTERITNQAGRWVGGTLSDTDVLYAKHVSKYGYGQILALWLLSMSALLFRVRLGLVFLLSFSRLMPYLCMKSCLFSMLRFLPLFLRLLPVQGPKVAIRASAHWRQQRTGVSQPSYPLTPIARSAICWCGRQAQ